MMMLCLLLSACGGTESRMQEALQFRTALLGAPACSFTLELTAQGENEAFACTLACAVSQDGTTEVTVLSPEEIAGVSAAVGDGGAAVRYEGVRLDFGELSGSVTPVGAPGLLYAAWTGGYIAAAGQEDDATLTRYLLGSGSDERQVDTWFDATGAPVACEVVEGGVTVLQCRITDWRLETASDAISPDFAHIPADET